RIVRAYGMSHRGKGAAMLGRLAQLRPNDLIANVSAARANVEAHGVDAARPYIVQAERLLTALPAGTVYPCAQRSYGLVFPAHELWVQRRVKEASALLETVSKRADVAAEGDWAFILLGSSQMTLGQLRRADQTFSRIQDPGMRAVTFAQLALARDDLQGIVHQLGSYLGTHLTPVSLLVRAGNLSAAERVLKGVLGFQREPFHQLLSPDDAHWAAAEIEEARGNLSVVHDAIAAGAPWTQDMSG